MREKGTILIIFLLTIALFLAGCAPLVGNTAKNTTVYTTFYPIYALTEMVADGAENLELHCMVQPQDDCLRSYEISDWDLYMLAYSADALLAAGNGLEGFSDSLQQIGETSLPVAEVMYGFDLYQMGKTGDEESHFEGENPHLYMSVNGAEAIIENIAAAMMLFDEQNAALYEENLSMAHEKLHVLKETIKKETEVCENIPSAVLNETFFYTAQECGLLISNWYQRESGEMLYGDNLENCLKALEENGIRLVLIEKQAPSALVAALQDAGYTVAQLDTMSTLAEVDGAKGYMQVLESNARIVAEACRSIEE